MAKLWNSIQPNPQIYSESKIFEAGDDKDAVKVEDLAFDDLPLSVR